MSVSYTRLVCLLLWLTYKFLEQMQSSCLCCLTAPHASTTSYSKCSKINVCWMNEPRGWSPKPILEYFWLKWDRKAKMHAWCFRYSSAQGQFLCYRGCSRWSPCSDRACVSASPGAIGIPATSGFLHHPHVVHRSPSKGEEAKGKWDPTLCCYHAACSRKQQAQCFPWKWLCS